MENDRKKSKNMAKRSGMIQKNQKTGDNRSVQRQKLKKRVRRGSYDGLKLQITANNPKTWPSVPE
jgi:hypothetical protein